MTKTKILVLSASYGEGHNTAARALCSAFAEHPTVEVEMVDLFARLAPRIDQLSRKVYLGLINRAPGVWSRVYRWLDRTDSAGLLLRCLIPQRRALGRLLDLHQPDAICSTYPVYSWLLQQLRSRGQPIPRTYTVVTDALSIHSLWYRAPSDKWFVTDEDSADFLRQKVSPPNRVHVSGFPVSLAFADRNASHQPPDLRSNRQRRILYMINSGNAHAVETARALMQLPHAHVTVTAGRNAPLRKRLEALARGSSTEVEVMGWTNRVPELLMTHHLVIGKAGGATTQESINALCPMLVNQIVPGQEEGNWELLRRHGAGAFAETPEAILQTLHQAFANDGALVQQWRRSLQRLARPSAARDIAAQVLTDSSVTLAASH